MGSTEPTFSKFLLYIATLVMATAQGVATVSAMSGTSLFRFLDPPVMHSQVLLILTTL